MEKLSQAVLIEKRRNLLAPDVLTQFQNSLKASNGAALIIVHPYFSEIQHGLKASYAIYRERLKNSVIKYQSMNLPIVIMEGYPIKYSLDTIYDRLNVAPADIYTVETENADPMPLGTKLLDFSRNLKNAGLAKAIVMGSNIWLTRREYAFPLYNSHPLRKKFNLFGCVGEVIKTLSASGVYAVPGRASYPGRFKEGFHIT